MPREMKFVYYRNILLLTLGLCAATIMPTGIMFLLFCLVVGFIPRWMDIKRLVALTAAVLVATQFVYSHGGGSYIGFYIAPFIIILFGLNALPFAEN